MLSSSSTPTPTSTSTSTSTTITAYRNSTNNSTLNLNLNHTLSSSSFSKPQQTRTNSAPTNRTMEEVWKDINLASLNEQSTRPISTTFGGILFQDFLARPFTINDPQNTSSNSSSYSSASEGGSLYCSASPTPHPLTALSLGSRPDFHHHHHHHRHNLASNGVHGGGGGSSNGGCFRAAANPSSSSSSPFDSLPCSSSLPCFGNKRFPEPADAATGGDRKNKRMIKNRESAARSRARKQAYTNELQLKVDHLLEENARLKRQQQQLCEAAASQQKKRSHLYRTSTF